MFRPFNITMTGSAQRLSTLMSLTSELDVPIRALVMQPAGANAGVIYVGDASVSSTDYAFRLEAATAGIPPAPFILGETPNGTFRLSEIYIVGSNNEVLHVGIIT